MSKIIYGGVILNFLKALFFVQKREKLNLKNKIIRKRKVIKIGQYKWKDIKKWITRNRKSKRWNNRKNTR